jgi:hypothetical protein
MRGLELRSETKRTLKDPNCTVAEGSGKSRDLLSMNSGKSVLISRSQRNSRSDHSQSDRHEAFSRSTSYRFLSKNENDLPSRVC